MSDKWEYDPTPALNRRADRDESKANAHSELAAPHCSDAGTKSEVCPECRGRCGEVNADVTIFTPCPLCNGNGSVKKSEAQPNPKI